MTIRVLLDYQELLAERVARVSILGEIDVSENEWRELRELITTRVNRQGFHDATEYMRTHAPSAFAFFLVAHGVYAYKGGDYWSDIAALTSVSTARLSIHWGQFFEEFLRRYDLEIFPIQGARRYVDQILLHGGIPNYCLRDFFVHLLQPSLETPELADLPVAQLVDAWQNMPVFERVDLPVRNFLTHGGPVMLDFIARSREMARQIAAGQTPSALDLGLPKRVVDHYLAVAQTTRGVPRSSRLRLRPPHISIDPWGATLLLKLPEQALPAAAGQPAAVWYVENRHQQRLPAPARLVETAWRTPNISHTIDSFAHPLKITFQDGLGSSRTWTFPLTSHGTSLMAFDAERLQQIPITANLPRKLLWLMYSEDVTLHSPGGALVEEGAAFADERGGYRVECWDLTEAEAVICGNTAISLEHQGRAIPRLAEKPSVNHHEEWPIYCAGAPELIIPTPQRHGQSLKGWILGIEHESRSETILLDTLASVRWEGTSAHIPLWEIASLGAAAFGRFTLSLLGPLGSGAEFRFGLVPKLDLAGANRLRIPDGEGKLPEHSVVITTEHDIGIVCSASDAQIEAISPGQLRVTAPPECTQLDLMLCRTDSNRTTELPFTLILPTLRWSIGTRNTPAYAPSTQCLVKPHTWLLNSSMPELHVTGEPPGILLSNIQFRLLVAYSRTGTPQVLRPLHGHQQRRAVRFDLRDILDSVRASSEAVIRIDLEMAGSAVGSRPVAIPVLRIERTRPTLCTVRLETSGATQRITARWSACDGINGKQIRLWSLWRPWDAPCIFHIPDDAMDGAVWQLNSPIRPGEYLAEMVIEDGWSPNALHRPEESASIVIPVTIGTDAERQQLQVSELNTAEGRFSLLLTTSDEHALRQHISWISQQWHTRYLPIALHTLVRDLERTPHERYLSDTGWRIQLLGLLRQNPDALWTAVTQLGQALSTTALQRLETVLRTLGLLYMIGVTKNTHTRAIQKISLSANGQLLASSDTDSTTRVWHVERGVMTCLQTFRGRASNTGHIALSPNGEVIAFARSDGTIQLCDSQTGAIQQTFRVSGSPLAGLTFNLDGTHLAACSLDRRVCIWELRTSAQVFMQSVPGSDLSQIAVSPDSHYLAVATRQGGVIFDLRHEGIEPYTFRTPAMARSIAIQSADSSLVAIGCADGVIRRCQLTTHKELLPIPSRYGVVHTLAFRADSRSLAAGYGNGVIALWRMCSGDLLQILNPPNQAITDIAFSTDGHTMVAIDNRGDFKIYGSAPRW